jgi:hypothetical protein
MHLLANFVIKLVPGRRQVGPGGVGPRQTGLAASACICTQNIKLCLNQKKSWAPLSRKLLLVFPVFFNILILYEYQHFLGVLFIVFTTKALDKIFQLYRLVWEQKKSMHI